MRIALVHDFLIEYGGAERVLEILHETWPEAPVYTAFYDLKKLGPHASRFKNWDIRPSWLQKWLTLKKLHSPLRFLTPWVWEHFDFSDYDVVFISSGWYIPRGVALKNYKNNQCVKIRKLGSVPEKTHRGESPIFICYLHTVPRYLYGYATKINWQKYWPVKIYGNIINFFLRIYDFSAAQAVDYFIANSEETRRRIQKFYRKDAIVIYPPVEKKSQIPNSLPHRQAGKLQINLKFNPPIVDQNLKKNYFLCVSRLAGPKRIDLAIRACNELKLPLIIVGRGPEEKYLKSIAGQTVKFFGEISDEELSLVYQKAKALIFPAIEEDFGIVPVEAMSYGKPVIALRSGGVVESVIEGKTGTFFDKPEVDDLIMAIKRFNDSIHQYKREDCLKQAEKFSKQVFVKKIKNFVESKKSSY